MTSWVIVMGFRLPRDHCMVCVDLVCGVWHPAGLSWRSGCGELRHPTVRRRCVCVVVYTQHPASRFCVASTLGAYAASNVSFCVLRLAFCIMRCLDRSCVPSALQVEAGAVINQVPGAKPLQPYRRGSSSFRWVLLKRGRGRSADQMGSGPCGALRNSSSGLVVILSHSSDRVGGCGRPVLSEAGLRNVPWVASN